MTTNEKIARRKLSLLQLAQSPPAAPGPQHERANAGPSFRRRRPQIRTNQAGEDDDQEAIPKTSRLS
jgi:hypothetical protein